MQRCVRAKLTAQWRRGVATAARPPRGMKDLLPPAKLQQNNIVNTLSKCAESYGFLPIETPLVEHAEVFQRSLGEGSDIVSKEMYTFRDRSRQLLTLRPENTAGIVRALISNKQTQGVHRLYYAGPMFRYERPQRGRYRQFWQFGCELVGVDHPSSDVESLALAWECLQQLGLQGSVKLQLNSLGSQDSQQHYARVLEEYFHARRMDLSEDSKSRLDRGSILRILDSKAPQDQGIIEGAPDIFDFLLPECKERFERVLELCDGIGMSFNRNKNLVRGLDYYTHTIFEFVVAPDSDTEGDQEESLGHLGTVLAGGRYDNLVEQFGGPRMSAIGWAAGLERLLTLSQVEGEQLQPLIVVAPIAAKVSQVPQSTQAMLEAKALGLAQHLRANGYRVQLQYAVKSPRNAVQGIDKIGGQIALLLGEDEADKGCVSVRNMAEREQTTVPLQDLHSYLSTLSGEHA